MNTRVIRYLLPGMFLVGLLAGFARPVERVVLAVQAPGDSHHSVPVYAQFMVTQLLSADPPLTLNKVVIPLHIPSAGQPVTVRLLAKEALIQEWPLPPEAVGRVDVELPLSSPRRLSGAVAIQLDGRPIAHEQRHTAPRVFVEPDDTAYPGGHYRIAANDKQGDVAVRFLERVRYGQIWYARWHSRPAGLAAQVIFAALAVLLLWLVPLPVRTAGRTSLSTTRQIS